MHTRFVISILSFCSELLPRRAMAWRAHGNNNTELVENLADYGVIKSQKVKDVMLQVDRGNYAKKSPYMDAPQSIGYGVTISAPHMVSL